MFEAVGGHAAGSVSDIELKEVESTAIPGPDPAAECILQTQWPQQWKLLGFLYQIVQLKMQSAKQKDR